MHLISSPKKMQQLALSLKRKGKKISFVPTMGALHKGHLSLLKRAKKLGDFVVASIFVNPAQFGPKEDYKKYPRDFKKDKELLQKAGCDLVFAPRVKDIYPEGYLTYVDVDELSEKLEGAYRSGHFRGVCTIVAKLFNIVQPDFAIFGQKDAQQAMVIKKMTEDLNFPVRIIVSPTVREKDGLACSSRNSYLNPEERTQAKVLYQALKLGEKLIKAGEKSPKKIVNKMRELINKEKLARIDYIALTDTERLESVKIIKGEILLSLAVKFGKTRLIDNLKLKAN
ncbi:MAG: pantoate--beta-alanine ligase [candidate division Zixibacteria bacterium]|nr:pantoate--beta-alanine ligase [candidate division Zixibacteria bacterium]